MMEEFRQQKVKKNNIIMFELFHLPLSPFSRKVRLVLTEKNIEFKLIAENVWDRRKEFLMINPAGQVPVLAVENNQYISDSQAICEYLDEEFREPCLVGYNSAERAEVRRIIAWFDQKFYKEVTFHILQERIMKRFLRLGEPNSKAIRVAKTNIAYHLDYIAWLSERRGWLAGSELSLADISAAAQISVIDYLGDISWEKHPGAKHWYARIKSRPSMRPLLNDTIPGSPPSTHYKNLDF